jgi:hypothetical protein
MAHTFVDNVTKPYNFIGFGAMDVTKPFMFVGSGPSYFHIFCEAALVSDKERCHSTVPSILLIARRSAELFFSFHSPPAHLLTEKAARWALSGRFGSARSVSEPVWVCLGLP